MYVMSPIGTCMAVAKGGGGASTEELWLDCWIKPCSSNSYIRETMNDQPPFIDPTQVGRQVQHNRSDGQSSVSSLL